jgi:arylsulfatase A-like enzyme
MDRLAADGYSFKNAVSGSPLCSPFRGSLLTGRYPHNSSVPGHDCAMSTEVTTIANAFKSSGYRTCWIGKWHLDGGKREDLDMTLEENSNRKRKIPVERRGGFEDWWAYENNNFAFDCWVHSDEEGETKSFRLPGYETDGLTDLLIKYLENMQKQETPFFAVLSVQPPHNPYVAPEDDMRRHRAAAIQFRPNVPPVDWVRETAGRELAGYYAAIERLDWNLGRIRKSLVDLGIDDHTYIMFFSDHGDMHGSHGQFKKACPWEESIRIPFIIGGPTRGGGNPIEFDFPINHVDISPTTLGLCGISAPDSMAGYDYSPLLKSRKAPEDMPDSAYISLPVPTRHRDSVNRPFRGLVTRDGWKYVVLDNLPWLMFNLNNDPCELVNLAHNSYYSKQRKRLHDRLAQWIRETGDQCHLADS